MYVCMYVCDVCNVGLLVIGCYTLKNCLLIFSFLWYTPLTWKSFIILCLYIIYIKSGMGGLAYALYASWRVALVVFAVTPLLAISAMAVVNLNQTKSSRAAKAYSEAGSVAYSTISSFRTVLSLNATEKMIFKYKAATQEAFKNATAVLLKQGFANGK